LGIEQDGKRILIVAHGNSLRGLIKHLDKISDDEIMELNVPTGIPFVYELDEEFNPVVSMKFMADAETVKTGIEAAASITRGK
jgi:2,3-bisphosphoglycerate-dependent phosphoglycerate mutase